VKKKKKKEGPMGQRLVLQEEKDVRTLSWSTDRSKRPIHRGKGKKGVVAARRSCRGDRGRGGRKGKKKGRASFLPENSPEHGFRVRTSTWAAAKGGGGEEEGNSSGCQKPEIPAALGRERQGIPYHFTFWKRKAIGSPSRLDESFPKEKTIHPFRKHHISVP